jgi:hypothetical protein
MTLRTGWEIDNEDGADVLEIQGPELRIASSKHRDWRIA